MSLAVLYYRGHLVPPENARAPLFPHHWSNRFKVLSLSILFSFLDACLKQSICGHAIHSIIFSTHSPLNMLLLKTF